VFGVCVFSVWCVRLTFQLGSVSIVYSVLFLISIQIKEKHTHRLMVIEMPNLKNHTIGKKNSLINECVKSFVDTYEDKKERIDATKGDQFEKEIMSFFMAKTTYSPKYVKAEYLETIRYRIILTD
jgi:hypothetical protein